MSYISRGNGPALVASAIVPFFLTWGFSAVRIYVRWFMLRLWKSEDWLFIASQISFSMLLIDSLLAAIHGNGQKLTVIKPSDLPVVMQYWYAAELLYTVTTILIRLSVGFFLIRICNAKSHVWTIRIAMITMTIVTAVYFFFMVFQCNPINYFWLQFSKGKGSCANRLLVKQVTIAWSVFGILIDMLFGILPIFVIWNLQMNPRAKAIVGGLLTLGIVAGLSVVVRTYYIDAVDGAQDFLYATSNVSIWSMIEPAIGICCMATPTFRPLFKSLLDKASTTTPADTKRSFPHRRRSTSNESNIAMFSRSKGSVRSNHTKNSDSFDYEMKVESYETIVEGPGKRRSKEADKWNISDGIMQSTTVVVSTSSGHMV